MRHIVHLVLASALLWLSVVAVAAPVVTATWTAPTEGSEAVSLSPDPKSEYERELADRRILALTADNSDILRVQGRLVFFLPHSSRPAPPPR